ncbi:ADP-ribose glycohydrolase OARD1-like [Saccoglossus kowalevskii]|uniref:O-acetyl-ADP-ribose deacetylase 1-like n=1 Tax=Saccoglossus kowalevskii TaxID=10224 RepID=A0ABM0GPE4_SACKO|nr:PREDICTED: O-acetyl-ADP-ribose deacetylase 1-like [Saccoglossus kowalevskii]
MSMSHIVSAKKSKKFKPWNESDEEDSEGAMAAATSKTSQKGAEPEKAKKKGFVFSEVKGDLFKCPQTDALAHCISEDCKMGKGIAKEFKKRFGGVDELISQGIKTGGCGVLERDGRYVYYMVTKEIYSKRPTYKSLESSLEVMKKHCRAHNVSGLSMPRIGCGLDGLEWKRVSQMLRDLFKDTDITISVYSF